MSWSKQAVREALAAHKVWTSDEDSPLRGRRVWCSRCGWIDTHADPYPTEESHHAGVVWDLFEEGSREEFGVHHDGNPPEWATEVQSRKAAEQLGRIMGGYRIETSPVSRRVTQWSRIGEGA